MLCIDLTKQETASKETLSQTLVIVSRIMGGKTNIWKKGEKREAKTATGKHKPEKPPPPKKNVQTKIATKISK